MEIVYKDEIFMLFNMPHAPTWDLLSVHDQMRIIKLAKVHDIKILFFAKNGIIIERNEPDF